MKQSYEKMPAILKDGAEQPWTGADAERAAAADPDHDWRITPYAPLGNGAWQRQGVGRWVLYAEGKGFA